MTELGNHKNNHIHLLESFSLASSLDRGLLIGFSENINQTPGFTEPLLCFISEPKQTLKLQGV